MDIKSIFKALIALEHSDYLVAAGLLHFSHKRNWCTVYSSALPWLSWFLCFCAQTLLSGLHFHAFEMLFHLGRGRRSCLYFNHEECLIAQIKRRRSQSDLCSVSLQAGAAPARRRLTWRPPFCCPCMFPAVNTERRRGWWRAARPERTPLAWKVWGSITPRSPRTCWWWVWVCFFFKQEVCEGNYGLRLAGQE